jgi:hypothetical protein
MPECIVTKDETGKLAGLDETSRRRYEKFRRMVAELIPGQTVLFSYRLPRSPQHHRYVFARLQALFDRQESFADLEHLLVFLKVGAGFVEFLPGPNGQLVAVPKSIAWEKLDEKEFTEVRERIWNFLWTKPAQQALWPHLSAEQRYAMLEQWNREGM